MVAVLPHCKDRRASFSITTIFALQLRCHPSSTNTVVVLQSQAYLNLNQDARCHAKSGTQSINFSHLFVCWGDTVECHQLTHLWCAGNTNKQPHTLLLWCWEPPLTNLNHYHSFGVGSHHSHTSSLSPLIWCWEPPLNSTAVCKKGHKYPVKPHSITPKYRHHSHHLIHEAIMANLPRHQQSLATFKHSPSTPMPQPGFTRTLATTLTWQMPPIIQPTSKPSQYLGK